MTVEELIQELILAVRAEFRQSEVLLTEEEAAATYKTSARKLQQWRAEERLVRGIHYQRIDGSIRYIPAMMLDRLLNWDDDAAHQRAIENWRSQQLSSQKKRR